jgi:GT2 family glycosyltransferase
MLYLLTLTWNACDKLTKLKESLLPALEGLDYTWLIKDNASNDDTVKVASEWGDKVKVIPYKDNRQNFSAGMNYLFTEAAPKDNDLVVLLNNDVIINDKDSIKNMMTVINQDDKVGAVGGRLLYTDTDKLQHAGVVFEEQYHLQTHFRAHEKSDSNAEKDREFQVVTGAVLLTKAEYFRNACEANASGAKGMDEKYHWAFDDVDFCLSIKYNMQKKIVYCGKTNIFHEESASLKKNPANKLFMSHNINYLRTKWSKRYIMDKKLYQQNATHNLYRK